MAKFSDLENIEVISLLIITFVSSYFIRDSFEAIIVHYKKEKRDKIKFAVTILLVTGLLLFAHFAQRNLSIGNI